MGSTLLTVPPLALDFTGSVNPASFGVRNNHRMVRFGDTGNTEAFYSNFMPEGYVGSGLSVTISWMAATAIVGDVDWDVAFERLDAGGQDLDADGFTTPKSAISSTTAAASGQLVYTTIIFTAGEADGLQPNEKFRIRIRRLGDNVTDTMVGDAQVTDVSINQVAFAGTLTVEEQDGNPSVTGVRVIKFDNTTVTDEGGDTVSVASGGGGGGGFFSDGVGSYAAIGKGSPAPLANGSHSFATGSGSRANSADAFAWGQNSIARGYYSSICLGNRVGYNDYGAFPGIDEYGYQENQQNICLGKNLRVTSWSDSSQIQLGYDILFTNYGYGTADDYAYYNYTYAQIAIGRYLDIQHQRIVYGSFYYAYAACAIVMGDSNTVVSDYYGADGPLIILGYDNNMTAGDGGCIIGHNNTVEFQNDAGKAFLLGSNVTVSGSSSTGRQWLLCCDTTFAAVGATWFCWGYGHTVDDAVGEHRNVMLAGIRHHHKGQTNEHTAFLWGENGSNGQQLGNEHFFGWSALEDSTALRKGSKQYSFMLGEVQTTNAAENLFVLFWHMDYRRAHKLKIEVIAYDRINNNQAAIFEIENIIAYRSAHTGVAVVTGGGLPLVITKIADLGGASAGWSCRLLVDGTAGVKMGVTGSATETVEWHVKLTILTSGYDAA